MCLKTVDDKPPEKTHGLGWKVMQPLQSPRPLDYASSCFSGSYRRGKWYEATRKVELHPAGQPSYMSGFHIFLRREDAETYRTNNPGEVIVRVRYRRARVSGSSPAYSLAPGPQVVADEMMIIGRWLESQGRVEKVRGKKETV